MYSDSFFFNVFGFSGPKIKIFGFGEISTSANTVLPYTGGQCGRYKSLSDVLSLFGTEPKFTRNKNSCHPPIYDKEAQGDNLHINHVGLPVTDRGTRT